jgi:hypothetical protein
MDQKVKLIKKYHAICSNLHISNDERYAIMDGYGVESSKDLTIGQLNDVCNKLGGRLEMDNSKWRKRVIACIFGYYEMMHKKPAMEYVVATACRAAGGYKFLNDVPREKLIAVYYAFVNKAKVLKETGEIVQEDIDMLTMQN